MESTLLSQTELACYSNGIPSTIKARAPRRSFCSVAGGGFAKKERGGIRGEEAAMNGDAGRLFATRRFMEEAFVNFRGTPTMNR